MLSKSDIDFSVLQFIEAKGCLGIYDVENDYVLIDSYEFEFNTTTKDYKKEVNSLIREFYAFYGDYVNIGVIWEFFDYL